MVGRGRREGKQFRPRLITTAFFRLLTPVGAVSIAAAFHQRTISVCSLITVNRRHCERCQRPDAEGDADLCQRKREDRDKAVRDI